MVQPAQQSGPDLTEIGARPIPEFDGVHDVWPRGKRLAAVRRAAAAYKERFKAQGQVRAVKSVDIAAAPYPVAYAFHNAVSVPTLPLISMINRMITVQYDDWNGAPRTLVFEPTVPDGSAQAPFYQNLRKFMDKVPGGDLIGKAVLKYYNEPGDVLTKLGLSADDIDFCTFDHLHVQDPRMISAPPRPSRARTHHAGRCSAMRGCSCTAASSPPSSHCTPCSGRGTSTADSAASTRRSS
ncbi:hypothetical protein [Streptomyces fradiae]|uniref:hypothetical protein n=1 Tax=Streptomyces fradiae TaxID=1906 RepID=UPI00378F0133